MKYIILILSILFLCLNTKAHTIKGKIKGIKDGTTIYLMTHPDNIVEHKWSLSRKTDSTTLKNGEFEFTVPDGTSGRMWLLRSRDNCLKYYFNKNEDITFQGHTNSFGLFDEKMTGGHDRILLEDIMNILDNGELNPIDRRAGIEWIKRHVSEDIGLFAMAYFYLVKRVLIPADIKEILNDIPAQACQSSYYRLVTDFYEKDRLILPGLPLPAYSLIDSKGEVVSDYHPGYAQIIFSQKHKNSGSYFLNKVKELLALQQSIPDLQLILIHPEFPEEISSALKTMVEGKQVFTGDYQKTAAKNPVLFYNTDCYKRTVLVNKQGKILATDPENEACARLLAKDILSEGFTIRGYVLGVDDGIAELVLCKKGTLNVPEVVDSAMIHNGFFTFNGQVPYPQYCNIGIRGTAFPVGFYLENSPIEVNITIGTGSSYKNGVPTPIKALRGKVYGSRSQQEAQYLSFLRDEDAIEEWISSHPSNIPALMQLATNWSEKYPPDLVEKWLYMMDSGLSGQLAYQETLKQIAKHRELAIGAPAPEFSLPSDKGKKVALKNFRGKYVLLDFWASWCGPCRGEIPNLKKAWEKYHSKGLEIVSITLDKKEQDWQKALTDEQMPWTQLNGKGTKVSELYNVQGIPHILLIDPKGKIAGINLRGDKLEKELQELLTR